MNNICLFCGKEKQECWDEYTKYYECNCMDAIRNREIDEKIREWERCRPKEKFKIIQCNKLIKVN